jgi:hypothetical protein
MLEIQPMTALRHIALSAAVTVLLGLSGCANTMTTSSDSAQLDLSATARSIYEGEIVTITTRSMNTLGTDADIEWSTNGGKLDTERNDRIARVKFDKTGVFTITAKLVVDGQVVDVDHVEVTVRQLTPEDNTKKD